MPGPALVSQATVEAAHVRRPRHPPWARRPQTAQDALRRGLVRCGPGPWAWTGRARQPGADDASCRGRPAPPGMPQPGYSRRGGGRRSVRSAGRRPGCPTPGRAPQAGRGSRTPSKRGAARSRRPSRRWTGRQRGAWRSLGRTASAATRAPAHRRRCPPPPGLDPATAPCGGAGATPGQGGLAGPGQRDLLPPSRADVGDADRSATQTPGRTPAGSWHRHRWPRGHRRGRAHGPAGGNHPLWSCALRRSRFATASHRRPRGPRRPVSDHGCTRGHGPGPACAGWS